MEYMNLQNTRFLKIRTRKDKKTFLKDLTGKVNIPKSFRGKEKCHFCRKRNIGPSR